LNSRVSPQSYNLSSIIVQQYIGHMKPLGSISAKRPSVFKPNSIPLLPSHCFKTSYVWRVYSNDNNNI